MDLPSTLHTLVINSLEEQIAVIDREGIIVDVNRAWTAFGRTNGLSAQYASAGQNYLKVLANSVASGDNLAAEAARGIVEVLRGKRDTFHHEYPCHSPNEKRWFLMRVAPLTDGANDFFVVSHHNITLRKLAEERTEYLAMHDSLTDLANRRFFDSFLVSEIRKNLRNRAAISLIVLDVDYFKEYNDHSGHLAGDQCLARIGRTLATFARRPGDLAARLGGDEFALILSETDLAKSRQIAESIRAAIDELHIAAAGNSQLSVSVGVASVIPCEPQSGELLLREADRALCRAKNSGRNQVVCAEPE